MHLPVPTTVLSRALERAILVAIVAAIGVLLSSGAVAEGGLIYWALKTLLDIVNSNIPTM